MSQFVFWDTERIRLFYFPQQAGRRHVLNAIKMLPEVCNIFCATANPVEVVIAETEQGRGILGVIDGGSSKGIEGEDGIRWRKEFLRKVGYKL